MMDAALPPESLDPAVALRALEESLRDCDLCGLCSGRTQVVFGVGSARAELLFVGEGPGFHEDKQGEPFVGAAGKLLNSLLGQIGLTRADIYIANVVKCRPPENRDPAEDEIKACSQHLMQQIAIIRPRVICTLGRFATRLLTGTELSMTAVHGKAKPIELGGVESIVFPVFHPAAALYAPANRVVLEEDFAKLRHLLNRGPEALRAGEQVHGEPELEPAPSQAPPQRPVEPAQEAHSEAPLERRAAATDRVEQLPLW
jgi:DNA polymerase